jgi:UDP-N-acetylmuramate dehydrogenase
VVLEAELTATVGSADEAGTVIDEIVRWRRENQPGGQNAGSVFTNPPDDSAGRLVDASGCKGLRVGTAEVSTKHANFIQADAGGSADDVAALIAEVQRRVHDAFGVKLHPELRMIGFATA